MTIESTATGCISQQATTTAPQATGTGSVAISSPHITQVRVPKRDDGKWMTIGSIVGSLLGKLFNQDIIKKAEDAEDIWKNMTDKLKDRGIEEFETHANLIRECDDQLWAKYCEYALCGYKPDYQGILTRVRADAALIVAGKRAELCRTANRYNVGLNSNVLCDLERTEMLAIVGSATAARENERQMMWKFNAEYLASAARNFETAYQGRIRLGADLMASAGENYAFLAESMRRTAEKSVGDFAALGAIILPFIMTMLGKGCPADSDCGCSQTSPSAGSETDPEGGL